MLDVKLLDLEMIAEALADQSDYEHCTLIDEKTGELVFWTSDTGIDGHNRVDLDDLDPGLIKINALPPYVWYQDVADFTERIDDERARQRLSRAIEGKGAFRRFKDVLHQDHPDLLPFWNAFRNARARHRAVEWLREEDLIDDDAVARYVAEHPVPDPPGGGPASVVTTAASGQPGSSRPGLVLVRAPELADTAPYAYAAVTDPGRSVFTAGACPLDPAGVVVAVGDVPGQAQQVMANLVVALAAAGARLSDVVKTTVYVASADRSDLSAAWDVVRAAFGDHDAPSTLLGVSVLGYANQLVEVEAVAVLPA